MVDVGDKAATLREAKASGEIHMQPETLRLITAQQITKGDVLNTARIAGIMAAKQTALLIPLCHPLSLTKITLDFAVQEKQAAILCTATVRCHGPTGVEIEALLAVQTALLTIYDMCKAVDRDMTMTNISLLHKAGGRSGLWKKKLVEHTINNCE